MSQMGEETGGAKETKKTRDGDWSPSLVSFHAVKRNRLAGIVFFHQRTNPGIYIAQRLAGVHPGDRQMGIPLNFFPVGFQFVLVAEFVEQSS